MEVYVLFSLIGLGYMASRSSRQPIERNISSKSSFTPLLKNVYDHSFTKEVKEIEKEAVERKYKQSLNPSLKVISKNYRDEEQRNTNIKEKYFESRLSGQKINTDNFKHNNMEPFFGGTIKQNNIDNENNISILENHTGSGVKYNKNKEENVCFADIVKRTPLDEMGTNDSYQLEYERMSKSVHKNNELPFEKTYVGPGLDDGFTSEPSQRGFQPDDREYANTKTIDELRVKTNPQISYSGVVIEGQKNIKRGIAPKIEKNKIDTFHEQTPDMWLKTTGAYTKNKERPCIIVKDTNRKNSTSYMGSLYRNVGNEQTGKLQPTKKLILDDFGTRNRHTEKFTEPEWNYGKDNILVFNNERDVTSTRTYEGNLTTFVKSIVAPIQDVFRTTTKEYTTFNTKREFGDMQRQLPSKQTIYDPNDITKTTIKETNIHDTRTGHMANKSKATIYDPNDITKTTIKETNIHDTRTGHMANKSKATIYDPNDITKTTIKETNIHDTRTGHMANKSKATIYDPSDIAKTTIKETNIHDTRTGHMANKSKATIYDPNDIAKTTIKETFIHDTRTGNFTSKKKPIVFDPDENMKTTLKETLENYENSHNVRPVTQKATVYDPHDIAKRTIRETTENNEHKGHLDNLEGGGGYETNVYEAPNTNKQFLSDIENMGTGPSKGQNNAYLNKEIQMNTTSKQIMSDYDHYGAATSQDKGQMSYEDIYNATINDMKEGLYQSRSPTQTSTKFAHGKEIMNMESNKDDCERISSRNFNNIGKIYDTSLTQDTINLTQEKVEQCDNKIDPSILDAFRNNPYTKSLNSSI